MQFPVSPRIEGGFLIFQEGVFFEIKIDLEEQIIRFKGLGEKVDSSFFHCRHRVVNGRIASDDNDRNRRIQFLDAVEKFHATHAGHIQITDYKIASLSFERFEGLDAVLHFPCVGISPLSQGVRNEGACCDVVIDDKNRFCR